MHKDEPDTNDYYDESVSRKLDEKLMELHSLFELSQTLNSSLNVKSVLDNLLLTPMGKMMIGRGIVLLQQSSKQFLVKTVKGLPVNLAGQLISVNCDVEGPSFVKDIAESDDEKLAFFKKYNIDLLIPLRKGTNQILGLVGFGKKLSGQPFTPAELDFLKSMANIAATAIENSLMVLQLQEVNRKLDKRVQELNTLFEIGRELNSTLDIDKIVTLLSYAIMGEMMVNRCVVFLKKDNNMELVSSKGHRSDADLNTLRTKELLTALCNVRENIDLKQVKELLPWHRPLVQEGIRALVPMQLHDETQGVIAIGEKIIPADYNPEEFEFLFTLGNEAMICLENARLFEEMLEKQRMEEELEIAREIQQNLLPKSCPNITGYDISAMNIPSQQVGGDYYDCIVQDDHHVCLAIADVSGKGIPASLLMANMQASLHATMDNTDDLCTKVAKINNMIYRNTGLDKFITFFCGVLNHATNEFISVNAGHNPPYLFHEDGSFELMEEGGLLLGMLSDMQYKQQTTRLRSGDWIIMYTDGVSEAKNAADEDFEEHRIEAIVRAHLDVTADDMKNILYEGIQTFTKGMPQSDDITMIIVKVL